MKLFDWLCGCDSTNRDEAAQYITSGEKKPVVICTEQPKPVEQVQTKISNGFSQNGHIENGHLVANGKPVSNGIPKTIHTKNIPIKSETTDLDTFSVPDFPLVENDVQSYKNLVVNVRSILSNRQLRLEQLIDLKHLPNEVDEDARAARGKIIVIVKNNLNTFDKLLQKAGNEAQEIADLTGFWGLVHKELLDVQKACDRVETSRINQWKYVPRPITPPLPTPSTNTRIKTPLKPGQQTPTRTPKGNSNLRAFMAQKRKEMQSNEQLNS